MTIEIHSSSGREERLRQFRREMGRAVAERRDSETKSGKRTAQNKLESIHTKMNEGVVRIPDGIEPVEGFSFSEIRIEDGRMLPEDVERLASLMIDESGHEILGDNELTKGFMSSFSKDEANEWNDYISGIRSGLSRMLMTARMTGEMPFIDKVEQS